jgi:hypothetical protein
MLAWSYSRAGEVMYTYNPIYPDENGSRGDTLFTTISDIDPPPDYAPTKVTAVMWYNAVTDVLFGYSRHDRAFQGPGKNWTHVVAKATMHYRSLNAVREIMGITDKQLKKTIKLSRQRCRAKGHKYKRPKFPVIRYPYIKGKAVCSDDLILGMQSSTTQI